jgi:hypothetical protein
LFLRLVADKGCTPETPAHVLAWFASNWPADLSWPEGVDRPGNSDVVLRAHSTGDVPVVAPAEHAAETEEKPMIDNDEEAERIAEAAEMAQFGRVPP